MYDVTTVNPNFDPQHSTNEIWRDEDGTRCLTDDLDQIELDITSLETEVNNKAPSDHNHTGFAPSAHTHQSADVVGLADTLTAKADLVNGKVPDTQLPGCVPEIERATSFDALPATGDINKLYITTDTNKTYRWNGAGYSEVSESIALGETANTAFRGDHGKTAYDHSQTGDVHVTSEQKANWDGKANGNHLHYAIPVTKTGENLNDYVDAGIWSFATAYTPVNVPAGTNGWLIVIPWNEGGATVKQFWLRHGTRDNSDFETYVRQKIGNETEWGAWSKFYTSSNPPTASEVGAIPKALQFTGDSGDVKENLSGKDVLTSIKAKATGFYTFYAEAGTTNNPHASSGWRYLVHKTNVHYGWLLAFGSDGSIYTNYLHAGSWCGWRAVYEASPTALWSGAKVMTASETVTPTKKLSECRTGWIVEWSDYNDSSNSAANVNFVQLPIYKRNINGAWDGKNMMFAVPNYISDDGATVATALKQLIVHDNKLVGHVANDKNSANLDVCLRAVYEF